jgi:hypothetical protein
MKKLVIFLLIIAILVIGWFVLPKFIPQFATWQQGLMLSNTGAMAESGVMMTGTTDTGLVITGEATLTPEDEKLIDSIVNDVLKEA